MGTDQKEQLKWCNYCKGLKLKAEFSNNASAYDGKQSYCKECSSKLNKLRSPKYQGSEKARAWRRFHYLEHRQEMLASNRQQRLHKRAILLFAYGGICCRCGTSSDLRLHRLDTMPHRQLDSMSLDAINDLIDNHKDEYIPVCHSCHKKIHAMIKRELALPTSI